MDHILFSYRKSSSDQFHQMYRFMSIDFRKRRFLKDVTPDIDLDSIYFICIR